MLEELQRRHYSEATTQRYIRSIERFAQQFHCSPDRLGPQHIRAESRKLQIKRVNFLAADVAQYQRRVVRAETAPCANFTTGWPILQKPFTRKQLLDFIKTT